LAKSEKDWNIGFAKCITSVSGAEVAENHDSWINSAEVPILSHQYRSREPSLAAARALGRPPSPVRDRTPRPRSPNAPASASNQPPTRQISPYKSVANPSFTPAAQRRSSLMVKFLQYAVSGDTLTLFARYQLFEGSVV
jgi:hypothetical protein